MEIKVKSLSFGEKEVKECTSKSRLLDYEEELLKYTLKAKRRLDALKQLKEEGSPESYSKYANTKRFVSLLGILHQCIKRRLSELPNDSKPRKERHINSYFVEVSKQFLDEELFYNINKKAVELKEHTESEWNYI